MRLRAAETVLPVACGSVPSPAAPETDRKTGSWKSGRLHLNQRPRFRYFPSISELAATTALVVLAVTFDLGARYLPVYGGPADGRADAKG